MRAKSLDDILDKSDITKIKIQLRNDKISRLFKSIDNNLLINSIKKINKTNDNNNDK